MDKKYKSSGHQNNKIFFTPPKCEVLLHYCVTTTETEILRMRNISDLVSGFCVLENLCFWKYFACE